jgi:dephospho-CoA kinase
LAKAPAPWAGAFGVLAAAPSAPADPARAIACGAACGPAPTGAVRFTGRVLKVGLTGGIGAGKSAVAGYLVSLGAVVIDSDVLAREVVSPGTEGLAEVVAAFGPGVLGVDGALDRPALGRAVFGDEAARRRLEAIIHPRVRARSAELAVAAGPAAVVVHDVPLLVEAGLAASYHLVIVVHAGEATRLARLVRGRGMAEGDARARIAAQASDGQRAAAADVLIANGGTLADLRRRVGDLWRNRLVPYEENLRLKRPVWPADPPQVPYDPSWPAQYARLAARIRYALGDAAQTVRHVGPTAIPGTAAVDTLDIELTVPGEASADRVADSLAAAGLPPAPGSPGRHGSADPARPVNLHVLTGERPVAPPGPAVPGAGRPG